MPKQGKRKARVDARGRNPDAVGSADRVLILKRSLWHSPQVSALSAPARVLMIELLSMHNGANNGSIFLSVRDATDRLGFSDFRVASNAFAELQTAHLISLTVAGHFAIKAGDVSKAHAWRLNWIGDDGQPRGLDQLPAVGANELTPKGRRRQARRQRALDRYLKDKQAGRFTVVESTTLDARRVEETTTVDLSTVEETTTRQNGNGQNPPTASVVVSTTHILHHIPSAAEAVSGPEIPQLSPSKKLGPSGILPAGKAA